MKAIRADRRSRSPFSQTIDRLSVECCLAPSFLVGAVPRGDALRASVWSSDDVDAALRRRYVSHFSLAGAAHFTTTTLILAPAVSRSPAFLLCNTTVPCFSPCRLRSTTVPRCGAPK
jgi:hypothetical protein